MTRVSEEEVFSGGSGFSGKTNHKSDRQGVCDLFGKTINPTLKYVCSDMWRNYVEVIQERAGSAVHILDRYHIMARMNKAIDEFRAGEARKLKQAGKAPILKHSRWCLLKNPENLTERGLHLWRMARRISESRCVMVKPSLLDLNA